jgi:N-hydroxyarylamine O-acetyltransferase
LSLPTLSAPVRDAYLARLGISSPSRDRVGLDALVEAHLRAVPFHNLFLLANEGQDPGLPDVEVAVEGAIRGLGGTCHQLSPPFACLLRALDFDTQLVAGDCGQSGDHLLVAVRLGQQLLLADVANGQPYMTAFPVDNHRHDVRRYGWHVRFGPLDQPEDGRTHALWRVFADGATRRIWTVTPEPRSYASFGKIIREHHTRRGFGPFLSGLRAVRMTRHSMLTLRDTVYERHNARIGTERSVRDPASVRRLLAGPFGMPGLPVDAAFAALARSTPDRWAGWGKLPPDPIATAEGDAERSGWAAGALNDVVEVARAHPLTDSDPRLLLAVTLTDRPDAWRRLVESIRTQASLFSVPASRWGIVAIDNSADAAHRAFNERLAADFGREGFGVHYGHASAPRRPISASRHELSELLAIWAEERLPGLPHPKDGKGPVAVWILDDDKELVPLVLRDGRPATAAAFSYAHRIARLRRDHPEISVAIGGNTGAPAIPAHATLRGQTMDLCANVAEMARLAPEAPWSPPPNPRHLPDYYYDHSETSDAHLGVPFFWEPRSAGTVREALLELCEAYHGVLVGQQVTRPLLYAGWTRPSPSTARGGNTLFFDLDALFEVPHPTERIEGVALRRADTAWAVLTGRSPGCSVAAVSLPVLHDRFGAEAGTEVESHDAEAFLRAILAQTWGTVLARLVAAEPVPTSESAEQLLEARLSRIEDGFAHARSAVAAFRVCDWCHRADAWWRDDPEVVAGLVRVERVLVQLEERFPLDHQLPRLPVGQQLAHAARKIRGDP